MKHSSVHRPILIFGNKILRAKSNKNVVFLFHSFMDPTVCFLMNFWYFLLSRNTHFDISNHGKRGVFSCDTYKCKIIRNETSSVFNNHMLIN